MLAIHFSSGKSSKGEQQSLTNWASPVHSGSFHSTRTVLEMDMNVAHAPDENRQRVTFKRTDVADISRRRKSGEKSSPRAEQVQPPLTVFCSPSSLFGLLAAPALMQNWHAVNKTLVSCWALFKKPLSTSASLFPHPEYFLWAQVWQGEVCGLAHTWKSEWGKCFKTA